MSTRSHQSRSFFTQFFPPIPRDYLARRRWFRTLSTTLMIRRPERAARRIHRLHLKPVQLRFRNSLDNSRS